MNDLYHALDNIKFPKTYSRKNISSKGIESFCLGDVNYRGQAFLNYKTRGESKWNKKFPELFDSLKSLIHNHDPDFEFTTIQLNKNILCPKHTDKNNVGMSYIIALGDFQGGRLFIDNDAVDAVDAVDIKNKFVKFDGKNPHWTEDFTGTRYSIIFFTHTFKPPGRRHS